MLNRINYAVLKITTNIMNTEKKVFSDEKEEIS